MATEIKIGDRAVGEGHPVFVIAEIGINHNGDLEKAKNLIRLAKESGADAAKLQTYITEKRVAADSLVFDILKQCEIGFDDQARLFEYAAGLDIVAFSTPFDDESVDFLASIDCPCFKIASFDLVNRDLLRRTAAIGKPMIVSRGMANREEIDEAVGIMRDNECEFALLHCVSAYPVESHTELNLHTIRALNAAYGCVAGLSDHSLANDGAILSVGAGASLIEKHFTYSREAEGADHAISQNPEGFRQLADGVRRAEESMGREIWEPIEAENDILQYRRPS
jgi:sialic acid synthase SpsE